MNVSCSSCEQEGFTPYRSSLALFVGHDLRRGGSRHPALAHGCDCLVILAPVRVVYRLDIGANFVTRMNIRGSTQGEHHFRADSSEVAHSVR